MAIKFEIEGVRFDVDMAEEAIQVVRGFRVPPMVVPAVVAPTIPVAPVPPPPAAEPAQGPGNRAVPEPTGENKDTVDPSSTERHYLDDEERTLRVAKVLRLLSESGPEPVPADAIRDEMGYLPSTSLGGLMNLIDKYLKPHGLTFNDVVQTRGERKDKVWIATDRLAGVMSKIAGQSPLPEVND